jgi:anti-sigma factor RsiW
MKWNCAQIEERLSDYVDGLLSEEERREFSAHVSGCANCAPLVSTVSTLVTRMHALEPVEAPLKLIPNILDQTLGPRGTAAHQGWRGWFAWLEPVMQPRFAMGVASLVVTIFILIQATGIRPNKLSSADMNPANLYRTANRHAHLVYARGAKFVNDLRVVYEIQSRLRPEAQPNQAPEPATPPPSDPQQKSEGPHPGRTANTSLVEVAFLFTPVSRSFR